MNFEQLSVALPAVLLLLGSGAAKAGQTINDAGTMACVTDKWDEKEQEKGHKLVDAAMRCVLIPDDSAAPKVTEDCAGKYEYMPDGSWKATGNLHGQLSGRRQDIPDLGGGLAPQGNTRTLKPAVPGNIRALKVGVLTYTKILPTPSQAADTRVRWNYPEPCTITALIAVCFRHPESQIGPSCNGVPPQVEGLGREGSRALRGG